MIQNCFKVKHLVIVTVIETDVTNTKSEITQVYIYNCIYCAL